MLCCRAARSLWSSTSARSSVAMQRGVYGSSPGESPKLKLTLSFEDALVDVTWQVCTATRHGPATCSSSGCSVTWPWWWRPAVTARVSRPRAWRSAAAGYDIAVSKSHRNRCAVWPRPAALASSLRGGLRWLPHWRRKDRPHVLLRAPPPGARRAMQQLNSDLLHQPPPCAPDA